MSILIIRYNRRHETVVSPTNVIIPGGGDSAYDKGGDARRKFLIKPLKETDLGVAQAFLTRKRDHVKTQTIYIYILYFFACNRKRDLHG